MKMITKDERNSGESEIGGRPTQLALSDVARDYILKTLEACDGNRSVAARLLGISIRTLRSKIMLYRRQGYDLPYAKNCPRRFRVTRMVAE